MADEIKVNTTLVAESGAAMETENTQRHQTLLDNQKEVNGLTGAWTGETSDTIIPLFYQFGSKHFQNRFETISLYALFLQKVVATGYAETEAVNTAIASEFK